jgi:hypothetical protein
VIDRKLIETVIAVNNGDFGPDRATALNIDADDAVEYGMWSALAVMRHSYDDLVLSSEGVEDLIVKVAATAASIAFITGAECGRLEGE